MPKVRRLRSPDPGLPSTTNVTPRKQEARSLPAPLSSKVPTCARSCLASSIASQYDSACVSSGLSCICSNYSSEGYALGELALGCTYTACSSTSQQTDIDSYNVCSAVQDAVQPTHTVLTVAPMPTSASSASSSGSSTSPTSSTNTISSSTTSFPTSSSNGSSATTIPNATSASDTATNTTQPVAHAGLTSSQTAGVSIGCVAALAMIVALIVWFVLWRKRRREANTYVDEKDGFDFIDHTPAQFSTNDFQSFRAPMPASSHLAPGELQGSCSFGAAIAPSTTNVGHGAAAQIPTARSIQKPPIAGIGIGGAMSSQKASSPPLRGSNESTRTVSQLLPDKPVSSPPRNRGTHLHPNAASQVQVSPPRTAATLFEPARENPSLQPPRAPMRPSLPFAMQPPLRVDSGQQPPPRVDNGQRRPAEEPRQPALSLQIPRQANRPAPQQMTHPPRTSSNQRFGTQPPAVANNSPKREVTKPKTLPSNVSNMAQLRHYRVVNPDASHHGSTTEPSSADPDSATPIDEDEQRRRVVPAAIRVAKPTYPPRAVRKQEPDRSQRDSTGSNTSFESLDDEPERAKAVDERQLSPVQEHSPISGIKYPQIPRSAHHSPGMYTGSPRQARSDVPAPLRVGRTASAMTPPRQTGQTAWPAERNAPRTQIVEAGPLSPQWGPKLTPSRRGDDLYLSVSLASPR